MRQPSTPEKPTSAKPLKLLDQVAAKVRLKHYSHRTELSYVYWIKRYTLFHGKRHPKDYYEHPSLPYSLIDDHFPKLKISML